MHLSRFAKVSIAACIALTGIAVAQDDTSKGKQLADTMKASAADGGMQRWQESMTPQLAHEFLAENFTGTWKTTATASGMGDAEMEMSWTAESKAVFGGRYIEHRASGEFMGMPTESMMIMGYDNVRGLFHVTMYDSMSTGVRTLWGNVNEDGTKLTFVGEMDEPMTGELGKSFLVQWTFNDDGTHNYVIKEILYGEPFAVITAKSERIVD